MRAGARGERLMIDPSEHALQVLEYDRIRDVLSSYCASSLGKEVASSLRPLASPQEARRQLAQTQEMRALLKASRLPLAGLRCIVAELDAATSQGHPSEPELLCRVADFIQAGRWVRETIERDRSALPELSALAARIQDLPALREEISAKVDSKVGVRDGATERLASLRRFEGCGRQPAVSV